MNTNSIHHLDKGYYFLFSDELDKFLAENLVEELYAKDESVEDESIVIRKALLDDDGAILSNDTKLSTLVLNELFHTLFFRLIKVATNYKSDDWLFAVETIHIGKYYTDSFYIFENAVECLMSRLTGVLIINGDEKAFVRIGIRDFVIIKSYRNNPIYYRLKGNAENTKSIIRIKLEEKK